MVRNDDVTVMRVERGGTETYQDVAKHLGIEVDLLALRQLLSLFSTLHTHTVKNTCSAHRTHTGSGHRNFTSSFAHSVRSPMRDIYVHTYKVQRTCSAHCTHIQGTAHLFSTCTHIQGTVHLFSTCTHAVH